MRYVLRNGREFTLASHTPAEWGANRAYMLISLGCSVEYAEQVRVEYAKAKPAKVRRA